MDTRGLSLISAAFFCLCLDADPDQHVPERNRTPINVFSIFRPESPSLLPGYPLQKDVPGTGGRSCKDDISSVPEMAQVRNASIRLTGTSALRRVILDKCLNPKTCNPYAGDKKTYFRYSNPGDQRRRDAKT